MANNFANINSNWQYVLPPSRPSILELERIRALLLPVKRSSPIAILGSTIEFRNLLHDMDFSNIYIFEKNREFYNWTCSWIICNVEKENVVWGDWLNTLRLYPHTFSAILSDLTMGNIEYTYRGEFYNSIYHALVPNGVFIDKVLTHCIPHIPIEHLAIQYERMPINLESINRFNCEVLFCSTLLNFEIIDTTNFYGILRNKFKTPILQKYIEKCHLITPENCVWYYGKPWSTLLGDYKQPYSCTTTYEDYIGSPYYGRVKHFICIK